MEQNYHINELIRTIESKDKFGLGHDRRVHTIASRHQNKNMIKLYEEIIGLDKSRPNAISKSIIGWIDSNNGDVYVQGRNNPIGNIFDDNISDLVDQNGNLIRKKRVPTTKKPISTISTPPEALPSTKFDNDLNDINIFIPPTDIESDSGDDIYVEEFVSYIKCKHDAYQKIANEYRPLKYKHYQEGIHLYHRRVESINRPKIKQNKRETIAWIVDEFIFAPGKKSSIGSVIDEKRWKKYVSETGTLIINK